MLEDTLLIIKFKKGSKEALRRIYEKYRLYLLKIAAALLHDTNLAEDIVHDVFIRFAQSSDRLKVIGNLKGYLRTAVINTARNNNRARRSRSYVDLDCTDQIAPENTYPDAWIIIKEDSIRISKALSQIPFEQKEVVVLHLHGQMKFRQIARLQGVSLKTIQSRYRYGLDKLRSILNCEVE